MNIRISVFILLALCTMGLHANGLQDTIEVSNGPHLKSPAVAVGLALGATIIPIAIGYGEDFDRWWLVVSGYVVGPSAGHFYAQQWGRGLVTAGLRAGLLATGVYFTGLWATDIFSGGSWGTNAVMVATSVIGLFGLILYDLYTTEESVYRYNTSRNASGMLQIVPYLDTAHKGYGLSFVYNF